nr:SNF2-related protein [Streptomyces colonosanans]
MLVVDEAHFVKNPKARRSLAVTEWAGRCERVLFLTGTPMENRVAEFRNLVRILQRSLAETMGDREGVAGSKAFRKAVAPNHEVTLAPAARCARAAMAWMVLPSPISSPRIARRCARAKRVPNAW